MASDEERAAAIAEVMAALTQLGARPPGSKLPAADWNSLIELVGRVARLPAASEPAAAAGGELPPGSVSFDELAPGVQELLRSGPFADPVAANRQRELDGRIGDLSNRLVAVQARLDSLLATFNRAETDITRQGKDIRLVDQRVAGAASLKTEVGDLRTLLGSVRDDIGKVLVLRDQVAGVDLPNMRDALEELVKFRNDWRDEQGNPVSFGSFSRRLAETENKAVNSDELTRILDERLAAVNVDLGPVRTQVSNDMRAELQAAKAEIRAEQQNRLTEGLASLRADLTADVTRSVGASIAELTPNLGTIASQAADERVAAGRAALRQEFAGLVDDRLAHFDAGVSGAELDQLRSQLADRIDALSRDAVKRSDFDAGLADVRSRLGGRVDDVAGRVDAVQRSQTDIAATLRRERTDAAVAESRRLEGLIDQKVRQEATERASAVVAVSQQVTSSLRAEIATTAKTLRDERDDAATRIVDAKTADLSRQMEQRLRVIANDAVAAVEADATALHTQMAQFGTRLSSLDTTVSGLDTRVTRIDTRVTRIDPRVIGVQEGPDIDVVRFNPRIGGPG